MSPVALYLDLLKRSVLNETGIENELRLEHLWRCQEEGVRPSLADLHDIAARQPRELEAYRAARLEGRFPWRGRLPGFAHTMVGRKRLDHLEACLDRIRLDGIPGDLLEAGIWHGGVGIFIRGYLAAHDMPERRVWLADSFAGLPGAGADQGVDPELNDALMVSAATVRGGFERFGLWDDRVRLVEGWFADTLPALPAASLALIRLDGDLLSSTLDALSALYPRLSPGAFVIIDDYHAVPECRLAVEIFRARRGIRAPLERIDWTAVFWRHEP